MTDTPTKGPSDWLLDLGRREEQKSTTVTIPTTCERCNGTQLFIGAGHAKCRDCGHTVAITPPKIDKDGHQLTAELSDEAKQVQREFIRDHKGRR